MTNIVAVDAQDWARRVNVAIGSAQADCFVHASLSARLVTGKVKVLVTHLARDSRRYVR